MEEYFNEIENRDFSKASEEEILKLQYALNSIGYKPASGNALKYTGIYDPNTEVSLNQLKKDFAFYRLLRNYNVVVISPYEYEKLLNENWEKRDQAADEYFPPMLDETRKMLKRNYGRTLLIFGMDDLSGEFGRGKISMQYFIDNAETYDISLSSLIQEKVDYSKRSDLKKPELYVKNDYNNIFLWSGARTDNDVDVVSISTISDPVVKRIEQFRNVGYPNKTPKLDPSILKPLKPQSLDEVKSLIPIKLPKFQKVKPYKKEKSSECITTN